LLCRAGACRRADTQRTITGDGMPTSGSPTVQLLRCEKRSDAAIHLKNRMPDRLEELRRQRALMQQHLEWLDREIAAETDKTRQAQTGVRIATVVAAAVPKVSPPPAQSPITETSPAAAARTVTPEAVSDPDTILEQYRVPQTSLHSDVRKGCFLYFAAALALFFAGVVALYFVISGR
jgi:hypothetical protein